MRRPTPVPEHLARRAFHLDEAVAAGISGRMLAHERFERVYPAVYLLRGTHLDRAGEIAAARLALPTDAAVSHSTRLELAGVQVGPPGLHFTIGRDLHLDLPGIDLHRTVRMPPLDTVGVLPAAAWLQAASILPPIALVAAGDRLAASGELTPAVARELAERDPWRPGTDAAMLALPLVDPRTASVPESHMRLMVVTAGLERPEVNAPVMDGSRIVAFGDLVFRRWRLMVEYEGRHHATSSAQFHHDIGRYEKVRHVDWDYLQVTARDLHRPRQLVDRVYRALLARGYDGPPPEFGTAWADLFRPPGRILPSGR